MIGYSLRRSPGGRRYSSTDRALARDATDRDLPDTLTAAGRAAMVDPAGIEATVDVLFERESNRLQRATTTTLKVRDGASAAPAVLFVDVGVDDPSMDLDDLASGRHNPSRIYGIADVTTLDSGAVVVARGSGDELPVAFKRDTPGRELYTLRISPNPSGALVPDGARGTVLTPAVGGIYTTSGFDLSRSTSPGDAGRLATGLPTVWYATNWNRSGRIQQKTPAASHYRIPLEGRTFTVAFDVATDVSARVRGGMLYRYSREGGAPSAQVAAAPPEYVDTFDHPAGDTYRRVVSTFTIPHPDPGGGFAQYVWELQPYLDVLRDPSGGSRIEVANLHVYAGEPRPFELGVATATPKWSDQTPMIEQAFPTSRHVNRVELSGEHRVGQITSAFVEAQYAATPGTWSFAGVASGSGRLAVPLVTNGDDSVLGVRVTVEETTGVEASSTVGSPIYVQEVDAMFVDDVSDEIESLDVTWAREADPASSTEPFGNYEASTVNLVLDDTTGKYNPATNATLDVGHRIEAAIGVRYGNRLSNPRADDGNADGWEGNAPYPSPVSRWPAGAPHPTGYEMNVALAGAIDAQTVGVPMPPEADTIRVGGWFNVTDGGLYIEAGAFTADGAGGSLGTWVHAAANGEWEYLTATKEVATDLATYPLATIRVTLEGEGGGAITYGHFTNLTLEVLDAAGRVLKVEEVLPAGVFYSEPYETDSGSPTVSISGTDRLGRLQTVAVDEPVRVGETAGDVIVDLALRYLDLDADQVHVGPTPGGYVIPYAYAAGGQVGTYLADLAKATVSTLHIDALERLVVTRRSDSSSEVVAELRADNALIGHKRPAGVDVTTSIVTVNAAPLVEDAEAELWAMPAGGISILQGDAYDLVANYSNVPAIDAFVTGIIADGAYTITEARFGATRAVVTIENEEARTLVVADARVRGNPLVESPLTARREHAPSIARYGPRELTVDAPLIQTQAQVDAVATVLLETFRSIDDDGVRRIPDLTLDALGILFLEAGDRVSISDPAKGVGGDYALLSRKLSYADAALLLNDVRVREASDVVFGILGESAVDSGVVAGY